MYWLKKTLILWLAKRLLPIIDDTYAMAFNKRDELFIAGERATTQQINNLKSEAKFLKETELWKLINTYLNRVAQKRIVTESTDFTDVLTGKMILYTFDIQNKIIEKIEKLK